MFLAAQHELLLQIIERPDDDSLRTVLADRLNELGDPLGEMITVQLMRSHIEEGKAEGDWRGLKRREDELMREHSSTWHQATVPFAKTLGWRRGLPHTMHTWLGPLLEDGGLTVLAPIQQLELEQIHGEDLAHLFSLPLLRRVRGLGLMGLRNLPTEWQPGQLPLNVTRLRVGLSGVADLHQAINLGLFDGLEELELGSRWLGPGAVPELSVERLTKLKKVTFTGLHASDRIEDQRWYEELRELLLQREALSITWRGIEYGAANLRSMLTAVEPQFMAVPVAEPASEHNREPFGDYSPRVHGVKIDTGAPTTIELVRLPHDVLLARSVLRPELSEVMQSISLDASIQLQLMPMPGVLTALSFSLLWDSMMIRYEAYAFRTLEEVKLPLPVPIALAVVEALGRTLPRLREELRELGVAGWPRSLSRDFVLLGLDGTVKLLPPFEHAMLDDRRSDMQSQYRRLGYTLETDLHGTDDGLLVLLGSTLCHLISGEPLTRSVRPGMLDPEWKALDPLVEGCLSRRRDALFPSVDVFLERLNALQLTASQDAVARHVRAEQSSPP